MQRRKTLAISALVALSLIAGACSSDDSGDTTVAPAVETTAAPAETTAAPADTAAPDTAAAETTAAAAVETTAAAAPAAAEDVIASIGKQFDGKTVTVFSSIRDIEADRLEQAWKPFEDATGINIEHEPSAEFEQQLRVRVDGGNAPDIAIIPQPGLLADLARGGKVIERPEMKAVVEANNIPGWLELGTVDGKFYAPPFGANVKSMVWYSPKAFAEKGYTIPTTWAELLALSDKIVADGGTPWCVGMESGGATGWVGTDWIEDIVLRTAGAETYDKWVSHAIPFNDPAIVTAFNEAGKILLNEKYIAGGVKSEVTTTFQASPLGLIEGKCFLHRQANFIDNGWPEGTVRGADGDVNIFYFPGASATDKPVLGGGEVLGQFADKPEVTATLTYLTSAQYANSRAAIGSWLSPNKGLDLTVIEDPIIKAAGELLQNATVFRFDASDLMPASVGAGTFWKGIVDWVGGKSTDDVTSDIEKSWPTS